MAGDELPRLAPQAEPAEQKTPVWKHVLRLPFYVIAFVYLALESIVCCPVRHGAILWHAMRLIWYSTGGLVFVVLNFLMRYVLYAWVVDYLLKPVYHAVQAIARKICLACFWLWTVAIRPVAVTVNKLVLRPVYQVAAATGRAVRYVAVKTAAAARAVSRVVWAAAKSSATCFSAAMRRFCRAVNQFLLVAVVRPLCDCARTVGRAMRAAGLAVHRAVLLPLWLALTAIGRGLRACILAVFSGVKAGGRWVKQEIVVPVFTTMANALKRAFLALRAAVSCAARAVKSALLWVKTALLLPVWLGFKAAALATKACFVCMWTAMLRPCLLWIYNELIKRSFVCVRDYVLKPLWRCAVATVKGAWTRVLLPAWSALRKLLTAINTHLLRPAWRCMRHLLVEVVYRGVLKPIGQAVKRAGKAAYAFVRAAYAFVRAIGAAVVGVMAAVLGPIRAGVRAVRDIVRGRH